MALLVKFNAASAADKDQLLRLMEQYYEFDHLVYSKPKADAALTQLFSNPNLGQIWLIKAGINEASSQTVGYVALTYSFGLEFGGRVAFIDELFIEESYRGKGLGTAAVRHCIQECRHQGIPALRLEVTPTNSSALSLYTHLGFVDYDRSILAYDLTVSDS